MSRRELEQAIRERDEARAELDKALQDAEGSMLAMAGKGQCFGRCKGHSDAAETGAGSLSG